MQSQTDDDIFKRMFASFVARKTRPSAATHVRPRSPPEPDSLRRVATEFSGRTFLSSTTPSPPTARPLLSPTPAYKHPRQSDRNPGAMFLHHGRRSKQSKGSRGSRSSKGSKGSEKPVSASTEDAPPRKRARPHTPIRSATGNLLRTQSAHAGSLHSMGDRQPRLERSKSAAKLNASSNGSSAERKVKIPSTRPPADRASSSSAKPPGVKKFPCDKCPATFSQKGQLSRHIRRVHDKLRPHACEYCGRLFGARSDRTRHVMIVHKKVRQFPCERCGFQFQAKTHLEAHIRTVHDGERPFRCGQCGFSFGLRSNLLTHERAVHFREAKWNCKVCNTAFNRKHDMLRHMKLMHDVDFAGGTAVGGSSKNR
eukprot:GFKZ01001235.1.p1 GENE.GFKZ01001235.1~~GFKZ01001235.1.p1  ORF type:complete len:368 (+),score=16.66 GFKZ01001235.1:101-1204(+)